MNENISFFTSLELAYSEIMVRREKERLCSIRLDCSI